MPVSTTKRFEIRAKESFLEKLQELATAIGISKAEVIDHAVGLFAHALEQAMEGKEMYFKLRDNKTAKTARLEIHADDKFVDALDNLCTRTKKSRAEVIRDALNFYEEALTEWEKEHLRELDTQNNPQITEQIIQENN